jgi:hypothetical protein
MALVVALAVVSVLLGATTWELVAHRSTLERRKQEAQAVWLARAGVERAIGRLLTSPAPFVDENVQSIPDARLRIAVKREQLDGDVFEVTSEARYPADGPGGVVQTISRRYRRTVEGGSTSITPVGGK